MKTLEKKLKLYVIVSDTSGLKFLSQIEKLSLLQEMFESVFIADIVASEYGEPLPDFIEIRKLSETHNFLELLKRLDKGEASAIALCFEIPNVA